MTEAPVVEASRPAARRRADAAVVVAWVILAGCLGLAVAGLALGERRATYDDLRAAVASGDVDSVVVTGGLAEPFIGRADVEVHWRDGPMRRWAPVVERRPRGAAITASGVAVVPDVATDLRRLDASVAVDRTAADRVTRDDYRGLRIPGGLRSAWFGIALVALALLRWGPQPRGATRWAWFWMMWVAPPLGVMAFVVLGGSLSRRPRGDLGRRITGGWGFLLMMVVSVAADTVLRSVGALA